EQSAASHSLTLRTPLRIRKVATRRFAVNGTPTDSVLLAVKQVMKETPPDLIVSGINRGGNLGEDVIYSGTVAAAMEGAILGFPAIAFSLVSEDGAKCHWATAEHWVARVMKKLSAEAYLESTLLNVNIPDVPQKSVSGIEMVAQGRRRFAGELKEGRDPRGDAYFWIGNQRDEDRQKVGTDMEAIDRNAVTVTPLGIDLTHQGLLKTLKAKGAKP
ncbi:MAG: 5'/3'-nucleotidase SurE, partial [Rhodospirillaceae bacterium]|nr:5'/3'-nucleotidase SurE [Rhodospirillaceae bacterium]